MIRQLFSCRCLGDTLAGLKEALAASQAADAYASKRCSSRGRHEWITTPPEIARPVRTYAVLDFGIEADTGRFVFYESNSSGQYRWLEAHAGAPIIAALADLLAEQHTWAVAVFDPSQLRLAEHDDAAWVVATDQHAVSAEVRQLIEVHLATPPAHPRTRACPARSA